jgi:hypothetical protein
MSSITRSESVGSRRRRRVAIIVAMLLLIGLPLYLWPLRGAIQGLTGAAALAGPPPDPRSAKAVAQLPADVWDGLMGHGRPPAPSPGGHSAPGNLTRIAPHEDGEATLLVDSSGGSGGDSSGRSSGDATSSGGSANGTSPSGGGAGGPGGSGEWSPFPGGIGPFAGSGGPGEREGIASPAFVADQGPDDPPMPTPEPGTLLLVGFNMALGGAFAWRHLTRGQERKPSG